MHFHQNSKLTQYIELFLLLRFCHSKRRIKQGTTLLKLDFFEKLCLFVSNYDSCSDIVYRYIGQV